MIKQELLRGQIVQVNMYNLSRTINSKAVFNQKDIKTAMLLCQLLMDGALNLTGCSVSAEILKSDGKTVIQKAQIVDATNCKIVVSSSWRIIPSNMRILYKKLGEHKCITYPPIIITQNSGLLLHKI